MRRSFDSPEPAGARADDSDVDAATLAAIEYAATVLCRRWKPALLALIGAGHHRYTALARRLPGASSKMLSQQLRDLERDGLIDRVSHATGPRRVEYTLTRAGAALLPAVAALIAWGRSFAPPEPADDTPHRLRDRALRR